MGRELQRAFLWVIFLLGLFMLYDAWQVRNGNPSYFAQPEQQQEQIVADAQQPQGATTTVAGEQPVASKVNTTINNPVVVTTDLFKLTLDANGASVARAELLNERETPDWKKRGIPSLIFGSEPEGYEPGNVVLFDTNDKHVYKAETGLLGGTFPTHRTEFKLASNDLTMKDGQDVLSVKFVAQAGGVELVKTYILKRGHYGIQVKHEVINKGNVAINPSVYMQLVRDDNPAKSDSAFYNTFTGPVAYTDEEKYQKISFASISDGDKELPETSNEGWIAMVQHYFLTAWVPTAEGQKRDLYTRQLDKHLFSIGSIVAMGEVAPGTSKSIESQLYVGPQDQRRLEYIAPNLDLVVDYGWLTFLAKPIYTLLAFLYGLVGNWGWAIVLLTCLVKAILYPISASGYKSMARMREVAPRMKALQEKYGDDKQALNQAMVEFYRREKINPAGGCFPIMLQIPVFLALYWVLLATVELRGSEWLFWVTDLASPDSYLILPLLMVVTMILQMRLSPQRGMMCGSMLMAIRIFMVSFIKVRYSLRNTM